MGNGPYPFSDIGKKARDILNKDYNFDQKFILTLVNGSGLGFTSTGMKKDHVFVGDLSTQYKHGDTTIDVKISTSSNMSATITLNEIFPRTKTAISFKIPEQKSGKIDMMYLHDWATITSSIGLTSTPSLELGATIGTKEVCLGAEILFDTSSASCIKYNAGITLNKEDFSAALILTDKGETLKASYTHMLNPVKGPAIAAEMIHRFSSYQNSFNIGSCHILDSLTMLKTRFTDSGKVAFLCQREWRPQSLITLSAEYDPKAVDSATRFGLALALKP